MASKIFIKYIIEPSEDVPTDRLNHLLERMQTLIELLRTKGAEMTSHDRLILWNEIYGYYPSTPNKKKIFQYIIDILSGETLKKQQTGQSKGGGSARQASKRQQQKLVQQRLKVMIDALAQIRRRQWSGATQISKQFVYNRGDQQKRIQEVQTVFSQEDADNLRLIQQVLSKSFPGISIIHTDDDPYVIYRGGGGYSMALQNKDDPTLLKLRPRATSRRVALEKVIAFLNLMRDAPDVFMKIKGIHNDNIIVQKRGESLDKIEFDADIIKKMLMAFPQLIKGWMWLDERGLQIDDNPKWRNITFDGKDFCIIDILDNNIYQRRKSSFNYKDLFRFIVSILEKLNPQTRDISSILMEKYPPQKQKRQQQIQQIQHIIRELTRHLR